MEKKTKNTYALQGRKCSGFPVNLLKIPKCQEGSVCLYVLIGTINTHVYIMNWVDFTFTFLQAILKSHM